MTGSYSPVLVAALLSILTIVDLKLRSVVAAAAVLQEYCDDKSFVPTCSASDEVVIMEQATYGRMRLGKCVPDDFASTLGCSADVLPFVEQRCSGRRICAGALMELYAKGMCESFFRSYLEASFTCIKGWPVSSEF
jgi:hypothetical protein